MPGLVHDAAIQQAVSRVQQRAERQQVIDRLAETFVDPGITVQLDNDNHQIVYGRRGTGKTHVLKVIQSGTEAMDDELAVYVDMRVLGSSQIYEDVKRPYNLRVTSLLGGVLDAIRLAILEHATAPTTGASPAVLDKLAEFEHAVHRTVVVEASVKIHDTKSSKATSDAHLKAGVSGASIPRIAAGLSASQAGLPQS